MTFAAILSPAILETVLVRLAVLFLSAAHTGAAARQAAIDVLSEYHPQTNTELLHAATTIAFSFQALESLAQAALPDMPMNQIVRLRGNAAALRRESEKAQRRLERLREPLRAVKPATPRSKIVAPMEIAGTSADAASAAPVSTPDVPSPEQAAAQRRTEALIISMVQAELSAADISSDLPDSDQSPEPAVASWTSPAAPEALPA